MGAGAGLARQSRRDRDSPPITRNWAGNWCGGAAVGAILSRGRFLQGFEVGENACADHLADGGEFRLVLFHQRDVFHLFNGLVFFFRQVGDAVAEQTDGDRLLRVAADQPRHGQPVLDAGARRPDQQRPRLFARQAQAVDDFLLIFVYTIAEVDAGVVLVDAVDGVDDVFDEDEQRSILALGQRVNVPGFQGPKM